MIGKKRFMMLLTAALMAVTVWAAPVELKDAQWSSMVVEPHNPYFSGSITSTTNYPRDPGFRWDLNIVKNGAQYGLVGIGSDTGTLGIAVSPGDIWSVDFINPGTDPSDFNGITLSAYVTAANYTGWVIRPQTGEEIIYEGATNTLSWDLTIGEVLALPVSTNVTITSVSKLGLVFIGDIFGAPGGEDMAIQLGSAEAYNYDVWLEEKYPGLVEAGRTNNPDGDALDNWNEYAFGGNPTNAADIGYPVQYGPDGTFMAYIHAQRKGSEDLGYVVETADDLLAQSWTNDVLIVAGTNESFAADFAGVTNLVPMDVGQRFIRLQAVEK